MKKKVLASLISSLLVICMLGTSVFAAETVVFEESFEIEPIDGFYVSIPEIRAYSDTALISNGTFEDGKGKSNVEFLNNGNVVADPAGAHTGNQGVSFKTTTTWQAHAYSDELEAGVYELEAYVKSAKPYAVSLSAHATRMGNFMKAADANDPTIGGGVAENGHMAGRTYASNDWQRVSARYVFTKSPDGMRADNTATADLFNDSAAVYPRFSIVVSAGLADVYDATAPLYLDDLKLRKIENAVPSTVPRQAGMPTYPISALAGKDNAQVVMDAKNESSAAKDLTLITAYYNADGSLNQVLNVYKTSVPVSTAVQHIESNEFSVPAGITDGEIKTFAWSNEEQIFPYTEATASEFTANLQFKTGSESFKGNANAPLPGTDNVFSTDNFASGGQGTASKYTNFVYSGPLARTGIRALHIATIHPTLDEYTRTASGVNFKVKPDTKYRLECYVYMASQGACNLRISGASEFGDIRGRAKMPTQTWSSSEIEKFQNTEKAGAVDSLTAAENNGVAQITFTDQFPTAPNHARLYNKSVYNKWIKLTCEFETPAADALALPLKGYSNTTVNEDANYWEEYGEYMSFSAVTENGSSGALNASVGSGAWIDDIVVYEITE